MHYKICRSRVWMHYTFSKGVQLKCYNYLYDHVMHYKALRIFLLLVCLNLSLYTAAVWICMCERVEVSALHFICVFLPKQNPVHHVLPDGDAGGPALRVRPKPDPMKSETHRPSSRWNDLQIYPGLCVSGVWPRPKLVHLYSLSWCLLLWK